jgi:hypothetical protein
VAVLSGDIKSPNDWRTPMVIMKIAEADNTSIQWFRLPIMRSPYCRLPLASTTVYMSTDQAACCRVSHATI